MSRAGHEFAWSRSRRYDSGTMTREPTNHGMRPRILVVDDDHGIRESLVDALELAGYEATGASDVRTALEHLKDTTGPCVVLTDLVMPNENGEALLEEIAASEDGHRFTLVAMSASEHLHELANVPNVVATLRKPFRIEALLALLRGVAPGVAA